MLCACTLYSSVWVFCAARFVFLILYPLRSLFLCSDSLPPLLLSFFGVPYIVRNSRILKKIPKAAATYTDAELFDRDEGC